MDDPKKSDRLFSTTQWSLVLAAGDSGNPDSREALSELCQVYWYPVYALARHLSKDPDRAQDLTQGFFVEILERHSFKVADPERGRFRSFLSAALRNYLSHEREREQAGKRGGGKQLLALDFEDAELQYGLETASGENPDKLFEKRWARALLTRALKRLREETRSTVDGERLWRLESLLTGHAPQPGHAQIAAELGTTESAIKAAVHRLRGRFARLVRNEVAQTVSHPNDVDAELHYLFEVLE